jgi:uncharacterized membrane protein (UPF0182 family)
MDNVRPLRPKKPPAKPRRSRHSRRRVIWSIVAAVIVLVLIFGSRILGLYVDWLWFGEVGFRSVFWTRIWWQVLVGVVAFALFFVIVEFNVELARRLAPSYRVTAAGDLLEPRSDRVRRWVGWGGVGVSLLAAFIAGVSASSQWETFLLYVKQTPFGQKDAIFGHDVAFYVFSLPMWQALQSFVFGALVASLVLAAIMHVVMGGIDFTQTAGRRGAQGPDGAGEEEAGQASPFARAQRAAAPQLPQIDVKLGGRAVAHLSGILAAIFVVVGVGQLFHGWSLLYSTAGAIYGAGYTDVHIRLPLMYVTMAIAFLLAAVLVWNIRKRHQWWPVAIAVWIVALIVLRGIVPAVYQSLIVNPNQLTKERAYIANNLKATREAYQLNNITQTNLSPKTPLTPAKLTANQPTLQNIRLWDPNTLVTSYRQLQELRPYYSFLDADVDRYTVDGVYRETMLSPRELNIDGLPAQAQTWVNQHITYTHGFGVAMSAVNQVTSDGSPDFLVQDVPPQSVPGLEITQPRIYYGERGTGYSLVKTKDKEFDYPGANGDVYDTYQGSGGIPISPLLNRLAFSVHFGTIKFFTTSSIESQSRIIIKNSIQPRIRAAAPFLTLDHDPYMVIADGRLWWIQDAYTTTSRYPYSTPQSGVNYLRNSVKIVVDAYNGTMKYFVFDPTDPLLKTYQAAYPSLFTPKDQMPQALLDHLRYPEDLFNVQAEVYTTYHVDNPDVLYNKGDQWGIPDNVSLSGPGRMDAYYVIMKLPGSPKEEFLLMLPFVPNGRQNMISWLGARSDLPDYGKSLNYVFSKSYTVFGPSQVEATINQDPDISSQRTLWGQQGSQVIMGNLLVVPIEDSLLYVQPLYLESTQTQLPQLKRVIVFYRAPAPAGGQGNAEQVVAMKPTLSEALLAAFGQSFLPGNESGGTGAGSGTGGGTTGGTTGGGTAGGATGTVSAQARALIARANTQFDAAQKALKAGDFAEYGRQIDSLKQTLGDLQTLQQK